MLNGSGPNVDSCPSGQTACSVGNSLSDGFEVSCPDLGDREGERRADPRSLSQCIDSQNNLEQCGGCVTNGEGEDCTMIHGVEAVECQQGRCIVRECRLSSLLTQALWLTYYPITVSCAPGLVVSPDNAACTL